jgi:hypothetical protein
MFKPKGLREVGPVTEAEIISGLEASLENKDKKKDIHYSGTCPLAVCR